jgi:hypothetical protein
MSIRTDNYKLAAVIIARELGIEQTAQMLSIDPASLRRWMDSYEAHVTVTPTGPVMRNMIAAVLFDMIMRISSTIQNADISGTSINQLAIALGILVDKWAILATMASDERPNVLESLRRTIELPGEIAKLT